MLVDVGLIVLNALEIAWRIRWNVVIIRWNVAEMDCGILLDIMVILFKCGEIDELLPSFSHLIEA